MDSCYDKRKSKMYKCNVDKNGKKRYYQKFNGKWNRISNDAGEKAEKGKKKYRSNGESSDMKECAICFDKKHKDTGVMCGEKKHFFCITETYFFNRV